MAPRMGEFRQADTTERSDCGQVWGSPRHDVDQSWLRIRAPISPPLSMKESEVVIVVFWCGFFGCPVWFYGRFLGVAVVLVCLFGALVLLPGRGWGLGGGETGRRHGFGGRMAAVCGGRGLL